MREQKLARLLLVMLGSGLGGGARYLIGIGVARVLGAGFPYGTLIVNVFGSFLISLIVHVALTTTLVSPTLRLFLTTGVMGGLTTYSTFNYETLEFLRAGAIGYAFLNLALTVVVCLVAGILGLTLGRVLVGG